MNHLPLRMFFFVLGVAINSFGVSLITVGNLGSSAISGVPYVVSLILPMLSFGVATFIWNVLFIVVEIILLRRQFKPSQFLQVVANIIFSSMIDVSMLILRFVRPDQLWEQCLCVVLGSVVLAFGIVIEVAPNVVVVPGEGIVRAFSIVTKVRYGTVKAVFDITLIVTAGIISLIAFHGLRGVGIGTVLSALLVGTTINLINRFFKFPDRIRALALARDGRGPRRKAVKR